MSLSNYDIVYACSELFSIYIIYYFFHLLLILNQIKCLKYSHFLSSKSPFCYKHKLNKSINLCYNRFHLILFWVNNELKYQFESVISTSPTTKSTNMVAIIGTVPFGAPLNSFHTKNPQIMATTGAALLSA